MFRQRFLWLACITLLAFPLSLSAQTTTGTVRGYVKDQNGAPVADAAVEARQTETGIPRRLCEPQSVERLCRRVQPQKRSDRRRGRGTGCQPRQSISAKRHSGIPCHHAELQGRISESIQRDHYRDDALGRQYLVGQCVYWLSEQGSRSSRYLSDRSAP